MKILAFILCAAALMGLFAFDHYAFKELAGTIAASEQVGSAMSARGREQYALQQNYSFWLERDSGSRATARDFATTSVFASITDDLSGLPDLTGWGQLEQRRSRQAALMQLKSQYLSFSSEERPLLETQAAIRQWTLEMVNLLDEIQELDESLLRHLSNDVNRTLNRIGYTNISVLLATFLVVLLTLYRDQRQQLASSRALNAEMEVRQERLQKSRQVYLSLMEDLSLERNEARRLSSQIKQANNTLQQRNAEMEQFIYTVSHDLKSPLVTISGFSRKLAQDLGTQLSESQAHYFTRIQANVDQMDALLSDLLNLSRAIRQDVEKEVVDTEAVIRGQCSTLEGLIDQAGAQIVVHSPMANLYANERQFAQCIANLFTNAIKYRDETRPLVIDVHAENEGRFTRVSVKDNGLGISEKYHQQIFRIFERLGYGDGTGVGLTIVKTIMERHAGEIRLDSEPGVGSTFTLLFPRQPGSEAI